jgi:hypothetical protein
MDGGMWGEEVEGWQKPLRTTWLGPGNAPQPLKERVAGQPRGDACRQCNQQPPISDDGDAPA